MFSNAWSRAGWALSGALALVFVASVADSALGGPLDPPGPVSSTYLTLDAWDRALSGTDGTACDSSRFKCVLSNAAILDRETGLVWVRSLTFTAETDWYASADQCANLGVGGRFGWRLPTVEELMSLYDLTNTNPDPSFPDGFPFTISGFGAMVDPEGFWTSTVPAQLPNAAYIVDFVGSTPGSPGGAAVVDTKEASSTYRPWCVRGGQGHNGI